jgi:hypothetical protein
VRRAAVAIVTLAVLSLGLVAVLVLRDRDQPSSIATVEGVTLEVVDPRGGEVDVSGAVDEEPGPKPGWLVLGKNAVFDIDANAGTTVDPLRLHFTIPNSTGDLPGIFWNGVLLGPCERPKPSGYPCMLTDIRQDPRRVTVIGTRVETQLLPALR